MSGLKTQPLPAVPTWLRASLLAATRDVQVDRAKRRVNGFIVAEEGEFKDQRGEFDKKSLRAIRQLMDQEPAGLKMRFGHPSLSSDALGKFVGRAKAPVLGQVLRRNEDGTLSERGCVRATMQLSDTCFENNPHGNLGEYLLDLAEKDPEAFGASLVLQRDEEYRLEKDGTPQQKENGEPYPPLWRPTVLHAVDVVDTPDATAAFLSADLLAGLPDAAVREACQLLDAQFAGLARDVVRTRLVAFLDRYLSLRFGEEEPVPGALADPRAAFTEAQRASLTADEAMALDIDIARRKLDL